MSDQIIPAKERRKLRDRKIKALHRLGYSMDEIIVEMRDRKTGRGVSKTTVFFAINGRSKKKEARQKRKAAVKSKLTKVH